MRRSAEFVIQHMMTLKRFANARVLFVGRFAEQHHLDLTETDYPFRNIGICLELDDQDQLQNPPENLGEDLCTSFPDRFFEVDTPDIVADITPNSRITLMPPSRLPFTPPLVPLAEVANNLDSGITSKIDTLCLAIHAVSNEHDLYEKAVRSHAIRLAESLITAHSPKLELADRQRRVVLDALPGFVGYSDHDLSWWRDHIIWRGLMPDRPRASLSPRSLSVFFLRFVLPLFIVPLIGLPLFAHGCCIKFHPS
ncbi:uncharacterized protein APUU_61239S [Aspergillus puulaauensis]|uniref:Uncharacterized protein n=1 Tax=Aspergillus puulaauensis TaxID=1220207 RepID=A0A7R7XV76_9EURO|nr:uncharacterized protein APUU_61239S [Aspergillus puulaauensis]BCS28191.1 hypothetical protein APUU_61239S [Aspergillus puulaauensis]